MGACFGKPSEAGTSVRDASSTRRRGSRGGGGGGGGGGRTNTHRPGQRIELLLLGLDGAGATTILYRLKLQKFIITVPTLGSVEETIRWGSEEILFHDLGGTDKLRPLWPMYQDGIQGVIYVVDAADRRLVDANRRELRRFYRAAVKLHDAPLLIFATKQDLSDAMTSEELQRELGLEEIPCRCYYVAGCSAVTGEGIHEGIDWIVGEIRRGGSRAASTLRK
jgi:GTPase SAR1 family protein